MIVADRYGFSSVKKRSEEAGFILDDSCLEQSVSRQNCCFELSQSSVGSEVPGVVDAGELSLPPDIRKSSLR